jgi:hypothetical protein
MSRPVLEVADIVRPYGDAYLARYGAVTSTAQYRVLQAVARCRTAVLGGHKSQCDHCGHEEISYNSCRNRHCPKCQGRAQAVWLAARERELLEVPYCHVVLAQYAFRGVEKSPFHQELVLHRALVRPRSIGNLSTNMENTQYACNLCD